MTDDLLKEWAQRIIDAIPGAIGMTPDPWPDEPHPSDGEPHRTVARLIGEAVAEHNRALLARVKSGEDTVGSLATMLGWENVPPQHVLEADIRALKARVKALEPKWQPIETAPKDGTVVMGWKRGWKYPSAVLWLDGLHHAGWYRYESRAEQRYEVAVWMPLPAPPGVKALEQEKDTQSQSPSTDTQGTTAQED